MKNTIPIILILTLILMGCGAGSYQSKVKSDFEPPKAKDIAVMYLDHPDINISNIATKFLEKELKNCQVIGFIPAVRTDSMLQGNNISIPRRFTKDFALKLKNILNVNYLLTGGITIWKEGAPGFPVASSTEVGASLTMYDLNTGKVVWTVSGEETGWGGIFAEKPKSKAEDIFQGMLSEWEGFCK